MPQQPDWRFCQKCFAMFFNGDPGNNGRCPAGDDHVAQGFLFNLPFDVSETEGQPDWRFCHKCFAMFFNGAPSKGVCAAGGGHENPDIGFHFVLPHDVSETIGQPDWRFCDKCFAMFFDGASNKGVCAAAGGHENPTIGFHFVLPHDGFPTPIFNLESIKFQINPELVVSGKNFTPNGGFHLTISNVPGKTDIFRAHSFDRKGALLINESFNIVPVSVNAVLPSIGASIQDDVSGVSAVQETSAEPFVTRTNA